jgi:hypothetical protein
VPPFDIVILETLPLGILAVATVETVGVPPEIDTVGAIEYMPTCLRTEETVDKLAFLPLKNNVGFFSKNLRRKKMTDNPLILLDSMTAPGAVLLGASEKQA